MLLVQATITGYLGRVYRVELTPAYTRPAIALATVTARNVGRLTVYAPYNLHASLIEALNAVGVSDADVRGCEEASGGGLAVLLWCGNTGGVGDVVFCAGCKVGRGRLRRLQARNLGGNVYLLLLSVGGRRLREYVRLNGFTLETIEPPCPARILNELCEVSVGGRLTLREAVDVLAYHAGNRSRARELLALLVQRGCIMLRQRDGLIEIPECGKTT